MSHRGRTFERAIVAVALGIALTGCRGAGTPTAAPTAAPTSTPISVSGPAPVVVDTDMGVDDTVALLFLLRSPEVDIRAVTIVGTGLVHCPSGIQVLQRLLGALGSTDVPISCGREEPLQGDHAFPGEWRAAADNGFGVEYGPAIVPTPPATAPELLRQIAASAGRPITIVALGPLTNLADAVQADPEFVTAVERIVAMGGAVKVPGNVELGEGVEPPAAEWNIYADPTAADIVFRSGIPLVLVPLDATNDVPVRPDFVSELQGDHVAAGADIAYELFIRVGVSPSDFFWDPLAAMAAVDETVVTFETMRLQVETEGPGIGRTVQALDGIAVRVATGADAASFETRLLAGLRVGASRGQSFTVAGTIVARFDGTACIDEAPDVVPAGDWMFAGDTTAEGMSVLVVVRFHDGAGWADLEAYFDTASDPTDQPSFLDVAGISALEPQDTTKFAAALQPGTYGIVCLQFTDTASNAFTGSGPFEVLP